MRLLILLSTSVLVLALLAVPARAHLMVAQHGTLNFVDNAAFVVVSLPISAFAGIDENSDGNVTMFEFNRNRGTVLSAVEAGIFLSDGEGRLDLQGILLSPVTPHDGSSQSLTDLVVMGRFNLRDGVSALRFENRLWGDKTYQQTLKMSATRRSDGYNATVVLSAVNPVWVLSLNTGLEGSPSQTEQARL